MSSACCESWWTSLCRPTEGWSKRTICCIMYTTHSLAAKHQTIRRHNIFTPHPHPSLPRKDRPREVIKKSPLKATSTRPLELTPLIKKTKVFEVCHLLTVGIMEALLNSAVYREQALCRFGPVVWPLALHFLPHFQPRLNGDRL